MVTYPARGWVESGIPVRRLLFFWTLESNLFKVSFNDLRFYGFGTAAHMGRLQLVFDSKPFTWPRQHAVCTKQYIWSVGTIQNQLKNRWEPASSSSLRNKSSVVCHSERMTNHEWVVLAGWVLIITQQHIKTGMTASGHTECDIHCSQWEREGELERQR